MQNIEIHNYIGYGFMQSLMSLSIGWCDQFSTDGFAILQKESVQIMLLFGNCNQISLAQS
jgi:hypothetical protein